MAEEVTPQAAETPASDPYDLGDTGLNLQAAASPDPAEVAEEPLASASATQTRNPDGTFGSKVEPAPVAPKQGHPEYLLARALDLGLDADEVAEYTTPQLDKMLWRLTKDRIAAREAAATSRTLQEPSSSTARPAESPVATSPAPAVESFDLGFPVEGYEPEMIAALKKHFGGMKSEIAELRGRLEVAERRDFSRSQQSAASMIDDAFSQIPQLEKYVGKGSIDDLAKDAPERKRRTLLLQAAGITSADQVKKGTILSTLKKAAELLYPDAAPPPPAVTTPPNGTQRITEDQWARASVARPTHRSGAPEPKGEERAIRNLTKKMQEAGISDTPGSADEIEIMEGLPG